MKTGRGAGKFLVVSWVAAAVLVLVAASAQAALVAYWNFNEGSGTTVADLSANANTGTLIAGGGGLPAWVAGRTGNPGDYALKFRGYTDRVAVPKSASLDTITNAFTIAFWAKVDYLASYQYLLLASNDANGDTRRWFFQGPDRNINGSTYFWSDPNSAWRQTLSNTQFNDYNWHHYAFTYSGGTLRTYKDGVLKDTKTISGSPNLPSFTSTLLIGGKNQSWTSWEGPIDDVVIFNTVEDVTSIMNGTHPAMVLLPTPAAPTVTWEDQGPNSGDTQKVTVSGSYPAGATKLMFFLDADGTTYTYGPAAVTSYQFSDVGDNQTVYGYLKAYDDAGKSSAYSAKTSCVIAARPRTTPATFYVSQSSGNDTYNGRAPSWDGANGPWKTLTKASTRTYIPGDQLLLKCGDTWNEELHPKGSGTPTNPIVIGSYGEGNKPIIDRLDYTQDRIGIHLADQEGFKILGIEFNRCMTGIYAEYSDNCPTKRFIWIEDCYFHDSLTYGHYENYPSPRNISLGICFFSWERDNRIVLADITIKNCVFRRLASAVWTNSPDNFNKNASFIYNFGNMTMEDCLFEEGLQWQMGIRGVDGGLVRNCVTVDVGRNNLAWNGVAGAMFFRCKNWLFEDSEWGFISRGLGSGDGEAFDFEGNCDDNVMRNCLFHDTDGPGFLICVYASDWNYNMRNRMENCVHNGKALWSSMTRCEIFKTSDLCDVDWYDSRFYLSSGEVLMAVQDPEPTKRTDFANCAVKNLSDACSTSNLAPGATASASSQETGFEAAKAIDGNAATGWKATSSTDQWLQLDFAAPITINEFKINEDASSSVNRYKIEYWDAANSRWRSCFNGYADATRPIGTAFVAPIVSRTMQKVRLYIMKTISGNPRINEFAVYNDTTGQQQPTVTWLDQGLNSGDTQKVKVEGTYPAGATQMKFFLDANGTTFSYGPAAETSHEFSNINDSQTVYGYVQAYTGGTAGVTSAKTTCTIGDRTPPSTPAAPTVTWEDQGPNSGDTQKVTVSGSYPSGATQLKFFLDADGTTYTYGPAAVTSYQFSNVGDSQTVYGYVRAYDDAGNYSADSAKTPCTIENRTSGLPTPEAPTVTWQDQGPNSGDTQKVTVAGVLPSGATRLKFSLEADGTTFNYGPATVTSFQFSNIDDSQTVYGYVRAYNESGNFSAPSAKTPCVVGDRTPPDTPAAPTVTWEDQGPNSGDTQKVTVSGSYPTGATQLKFYLDADGTTYAYGPAAVTSHQFSNVGDGQTVQGYVQAYDDAGNYSATSAKTPCLIENRTNSPPTVSITSPSDGAIVAAGSIQAIRATASDSDGSVAKVEFYRGEVKIGEDTAAPYECIWNNVPLGTHTLTAKATDNVGATTMSDPVTVEAGIPGDANLDGKVDFLDFLVVSTNYGTGSRWTEGDVNGDGVVDFLDFVMISTNHGLTGTTQTSVPDQTSVPGTVEQSPGDAPRLVETDPRLGSLCVDVKALGLRFDRAVQIGANVAEVYGHSTGAHQDYACRYDGATNTLYLEWAEEFPPDVYDVRILADAVLDADGGVPLDGEIDDPADPDCLPSGDGAPGGDAWFEFEVLEIE